MKHRHSLLVTRSPIRNSTCGTPVAGHAHTSIHRERTTVQSTFGHLDTKSGVDR